MFVESTARLRWVGIAILILGAMPAAAGTVGLSWDPSAGATGYKVHFGTSSGDYGPALDVGNVTSTVLTGLEDCTWYFFATTAYNDAGESGPSTEVTSFARPEVDLSAPSSAEQGSQFDVTFSGTNYDDGVAVQFTSSGLQVGAVSVNSCNELVFSLSVSDTADVGTSNVLVTNPSGARGTINGLFTVEAAVAPSVTGTNPSDGASDIAVTVQPTVQFSEPLLGSSVTTSTILLLDNGGTPVAQGGGSPSLSGDGMTATITPAADLAQGANYRIRVVGGASGVYDLAGHEMASTFTQSSGFDTVADQSAPVISNVQAENVGSTTADITWTTDEPADSQVFYRKVGDDAYQQTALDATLVTNHAVALQGLMPSTDYEFYVSSADTDGNGSDSSPDDTFTTLANSFSYLTFEAELGSLVDPVGVASGSEAFGGEWIDTPNNANGSSGNPAGTATFGVNVPSSDTWYLWVRMYGPNGNSNSWFESMNGGFRAEIQTSTSGVWQWVAGRSYDLTAGLNDFELGGREGGARADRVLLTDDPDFVPTEAPGSDTLPPESVSSLTATPGDGQVELAWTNPTDPDFDRFVIRYRTDGRFPVSPADGLPVTEGSDPPGSAGAFTHDGLANGVTHSYSVFALDESGNVSAPGTAEAVPENPLLPPPPPSGVGVF